MANHTTTPRNTTLGLVIGVGTIATWLVSLAVLLQQDFDRIPVFGVGLAFLWMTWVSTGLFITAHDAIHGSVFPRSRKLNDMVGRTALFLYAAFPYRRMVHEHRRHHASPATANDPDYHDGRNDNPLRWYVRFVREYVRPLQIVWMAALYNVGVHVLHFDERALWLFWAGPVLASTIQLFVFGTWLPHRDTNEASTNRHHAVSSRLPRPLSLLACFHFDYHWEHHEWPHLPWWKLPAARWKRSS